MIIGFVIVVVVHDLHMVAVVSCVQGRRKRWAEMERTAAEPMVTGPSEAKDHLHAECVQLDDASLWQDDIRGEAPVQTELCYG